ncbi:unnamed protein product [Soboliphyme baturini]|uniref:Movement protein n=1 Tax=Soboliphyme baturini TaxID=241478 RepID=A0A183J552_9BILA|nr:unnamed protein product [Soboliphyme baturini]
MAATGSPVNFVICPHGIALIESYIRSSVVRSTKGEAGCWSTEIGREVRDQNLSTVIWGPTSSTVAADDRQDDDEDARQSRSRFSFSMEEAVSATSLQQVKQSSVRKTSTRSSHSETETNSF